MPAFAFPFSVVFGAAVVPPSVVGAVNGKAAPVAYDLALNRLTGDLLLSKGDLVFSADFGAIEQEIFIRLKFLRGSWFLDTTAGLPYFDNILIKSPNLAAIRTIFSNEILASTGVRSLRSLELDLHKKERKLTVTFSVNTDLGQLDSELVL